METVVIGILVLAFVAGLAWFIFQNAAKFIAIVFVLFVGYVGWHIYLKDVGITPKEITSSVNAKGEKIFNDVLDSMVGTVGKVKDTTKRKTDELVSDVKESTKETIKESLQ